MILRIKGLDKDRITANIKDLELYNFGESYMVSSRYYRMGISKDVYDGIIKWLSAYNTYEEFAFREVE